VSNLSKDIYASTIMMVDDESITMDVVQAFLGEFGYSNFIQIEDPLEAMAALDRRSPDVLLLDLIMPGKSGLELLEEVRGSEQFRHLPVIVLTASSDAHDKLRALELGATDFLAKPVDQSELCLRVRNTLVAKAYMDQLAFYDAVTELPNIHMFNERLKWALKKAKRHNESLSLITISLDNFGRLNATVGLDSSNKIIAMIAKRLLGVVRDIDTRAAIQDKIKGTLGLFRVEGYGFSLLLDRPKNNEITALVAKRILKIIRKPIVINNDEMVVTASVGIASFPESEHESYKGFQRQAVTAKDHSKNNGGDCFCFSSKAINRIYQRRHTMESGLRRAIGKNELALHYQPKVDINTGEINGLESLLRWQNANLGHVSPSQFIPLAEETKLIIPIGAWVLTEACRTLVEWSKSGIKDINLSVNLSAVQMDDPRLIDTVRKILTTTGAKPSQLEIEITEGVFLENIDEKREVLLALKSLGVRISIDDFGTGYSSLSYLTSLPIDELKIDASFINSIEESKKSRAIVSSIIYMAQNLKLRTIAEGIETDRQLEFIRKQGCDSYQGYLFSRALPKNEITKLLSKKTHTTTANSE